MAGDQGEVPLIFGEVLFDRFPDGNSVLGGAPFNVAWHLQALGMAPLFLSRVGDDPAGNKVASAMRDWNMSTAGLQRDPDHPTGSVVIGFRADGEPEYEIVDQQAYDFIDQSLLPDLPPRQILYHGSLALRNSVSRNTLCVLKANHVGNIFMDVNLRDPWWSRDFVLNQVGDSDWVKLNADELLQLGVEGRVLRTQAEDFISRHALKGLVVTLGDRGAFALTEQGVCMESAPSSPLAVVDTVGAGDAFTAVFITGLLSRWPLRQTMQRAQAFASSIVQRRGAIVRDPGFYRATVSGWQT